MGESRSAYARAADIVVDSGGHVVGRTKLQKIGYLLELAGMGTGFHFEYKHYGPYSEELANAVQVAEAFGLVKEEEKRASWGGEYSIYHATNLVRTSQLSSRARFAREAAKMDAIVLELAATAAYLSAVGGYSDPWQETARRKPDKVGNGFLDGAKEAYRKLCAMKTPKQLPQIA